MYFLGGVTSVFFGAIMPELLSYYNASFTLGGTLVLLQSIGFIVGVPLTAYCMKKIHYRFILSGAAMLVAIAQIGLFCLPSMLWLGLAIILNGMGASSLETAVATYIMELFEGRRAIFMSRLEVAFGVGAFCMPIISSILIADHMWRFSSLFISGFALLLFFVWRSISISLHSIEGRGEKDVVTTEAPIFKKSIQKYSILILFLFIILVYVGIEGSLNSFLPSIFMFNSKASPYIASLSTSALWISMLCGRIAISWIVRRISYEHYLFGSILTGCVCLLLLTQSKMIGLSFVILFGLGFGLSAIYSITMVYANHTFSGMARSVTSAVTAFAGIGGAVFPFIIGFMMDHYKPSQILWVIFICTVLLLVLFLSIIISIKFIRNVRQKHLQQHAK